MELKKSNKKGKRFMMIFDDGTITHFGSMGQNFTMHGDEIKKKNYLKRHEKNEDWNDPKSAGALSRWILWNLPNIEESYEDYKKRFNFIGAGLSAAKIKHMSSAAYTDDKRGIGNFVLDSKLSTAEAKVYVNKDKREVVVSNRGTKGITDWVNNAAYIAGKYDLTPRFQRAKALQLKVKQKYPQYKITNIGHSQGGVITKKLNDANLTDAVININPASLPLERKSKKNETTIKSEADVISVFHRPKKGDVILKDKTGNVLSEHKTNILDRIDPKTVIGTGYFIEP